MNGGIVLLSRPPTLARAGELYRLDLESGPAVQSYAISRAQLRKLVDQGIAQLTSEIPEPIPIRRRRG